MIRKYKFGNPFETESVVAEIPVTEFSVTELSMTEELGAAKALSMAEELPEGCVIKVAEDTFSLVYTMGREDIVYGLGEQVRGINKRGHIYESWASDDMLHLESKKSLYGSHNFLIIEPGDTGSITDHRKGFGIFIDHPGRVSFDVGHTHLDILKITCSPDLYLYVITGESSWDIVRQFRKIIGRSYIAPKWAFGIQQSRWGYDDAQDIMDVIQGYADQDLPLDAVYLDIDYMKDYKDFTIDEDRFPDFESFVARCRQANIHLVPIIDAGVKIQDGYDVYEEGVARGYFCKDKEGKELVAAVWPGRVHLPDFLNPEARHWFGMQYEKLTSKGIDGFWNDMNEPALFYTQRSLDAMMDRLIAMRETNMGIEEVFEMKNMVMSLGGTDAEYQEIYHETPQGRIRHDKVHNIYGYNMTRAASEAFDKAEPDKRILMFSRSSCIGSHRYGGIWTGDNHSWWSHLLLSIQQMPSLNMCGFLYTGSDVGGFGSDCTEDLLLRWMAFGIFTPLFRNHSVRYSRPQEPYRFTDMEAMRGLLHLRYALLPYLYSEYMKAAIQDDLLFRPLGFVFPEDKAAARCEDQLMVGESIMIAPVYVQNAMGRMVYLPEDMLQVVFDGAEISVARMMPEGYHYVNCDLSQVLVFIRKNHVLPLALNANEQSSVEGLCEDAFLWVGHPETEAEYTLYTDDGYTKNYEDLKNLKTYQFRPEDFGGDCICRK